MFDTVGYRTSSTFFRAGRYFDFISVNTENGSLHNMMYTDADVSIGSFRN